MYVYMCICISLSLSLSLSLFLSLSLSLLLSVSFSLFFCRCLCLCLSLSRARVHMLSRSLSLLKSLFCPPLSLFLLSPSQAPWGINAIYMHAYIHQCIYIHIRIHTYIFIYSNIYLYILIYILTTCIKPAEGPMGHKRYPLPCTVLRKTRRSEGGGSESCHPYVCTREQDTIVWDGKRKVRKTSVCESKKCVCERKKVCVRKRLGGSGGGG